MIQLFRQRIGWKLFFSHLSVTIISLLVLSIAAQFISPATISHRFMMSDEMTATMGNMMQGMGMGDMTLNQQYLFEEFNAAMQEVIVFTGIAAFVAAVGASLLVTRQLVKPVQEMTAASQQIAAGRYEKRVTITGTPEQQDELGGLANNFNSMAEQLERTETMRRELIGDVAHELRTPLASIKASMEGLMDEVIPPSPETYHKIHQEAARMQKIIDDLQNLSRVEAGNYQLDLAEIQIEPIILAVISTLEPQYKDKNVTLSTEIEKNLPTTLADAARIQQVLINLVGNALQYSLPGGQVRIRTKLEKGAILTAVSDTGIGLKAEELTMVFNRFYRVDKSRSRASGGSGIGLTIAKHLVEAHQGRIWAESGGEDQGSTFFFTLPVVH